MKTKILIIGLLLGSIFADSYIFANALSVYGGPLQNKFFIKLNQGTQISTKPVYRDILGEISKMGRGQNLRISKNMIGDDSLSLKKPKNQSNSVEKVQLIEEAQMSPAGKADIIDYSSKGPTMKIDQLEYYPNPNNGIFNVYFTITEKCKTIITIFDGNGKEVYYEVINNYEGEYVRSIDLSGNGKGIYFLNIEQGDKTINKKLVIR